MNTKRIIGIVVLVVGIIAIMYANHQRNRIAKAHGNIERGESYFSDSSSAGKVGHAVGNAMGNKISSYNTPVMMLMIGGIVLAVVGAGMALFCKEKRKR